MFSDFAYSREMQLILMALAFTHNYFQMYFIAKLILRVHGEKASVKQKALFAFLTGAVIYTLSVYIIYFIGGMLSFDPIEYVLVVTPNPITAVLFCLVGIKILKLSPVRSIELIGNFYLYFAVIINLNRLVGMLFFVQTSERFNYLFEAARISTGLFMLIGFYVGFNYLLDKKPSFLVPKTNIFFNPKKEWLILFLKSMLIYLCSVLVPFLINNKVAAYILILFFLSQLLLISLLYSNYIHSVADNRNKEAHISSLMRTVEEFRAIKHDFYNILQTYSGYFTLGDMAACIKYHDKLVAATVQAGDTLDLSRHMNENPALVSLLIDKHARADLAKVQLDTSIMCPLSDFPIDEFDLCRMISCLLDNAIEAAEDSEPRRASLSVEQKPDGTKLIIITNCTSNQPDITHIFSSGVTSKAGHQGIGLYNVRKILDKCVNCTLQLSCYNNEMTAYVEIRNMAR